MKILILGRNKINDYNRGHQLFLNRFKKYHEVYFWGEEHMDFDPAIPISQVIDKIGRIDLILCYMSKKCMDLKGVYDIDQKIKKALIEIDFFPRSSRYKGQYDLKTGYNRYGEFFAKMNFDVAFIYNSIGYQGLVDNHAARKVFLLPFGVDINTYQKRDVKKDIDVMAVFTWNKDIYPYRKKIVKKLLKRKDITTYAGNAFFDEYINIINRSKIAVNSGLVYKVLTMKFTEIMACGTFLLTDWCNDFEHSGFVDGKHLVVYENLKDMKRKIDYYLEHVDKREKIAQQAREFVREYHSTDARVRYFTEIVKNISVEQTGRLFKEARL